MGHVLYTNHGLVLLDADGSVLHREQGYDDLFAFIDKDESELYILLPEYLNQCIDIKKRAPKPKQKEDMARLYLTMSNILMELHPFCTPYYLQQAILVYFHDQLLHTIPNEEVCTEPCYHDMFHALFPNGYDEDNDESDNPHQASYHQYLTLHRNRFKIATQNKPFHDLYQAKQFTSNYLYWVLDIQAKQFKDVPIQQRNNIFQHYHHMKATRIASASVDYYLGYGNQVQLSADNLSVDITSPFMTKTADKQRYMAEALQTVVSDSTYDALSPDIKKDLLSTIRKSTGRPQVDQYFPVYRIDNLFDLLFIECQRMTEAKLSIRRCLKCNRYFVAEKSNIKYCDRLLDDNSAETCRTTGPKESIIRKIRNSPAQYEYHKAYRTHYARIKAGKLTKQEFTSWSAEARRRLAVVYNDPSLLPEFERWLKDS
ncbi:MAG TPA: DUF6076 domain-containing protein [Candidatus Limiplasma sp.]|nr:DUF6076 domain-containing protein [Candidatus Limiplasma sp.]